MAIARRPGATFRSVYSSFADAARAPGLVVAVHRSPTHEMTKAEQRAVTLVAGLGVAGDAHAGTTVQHRSRVRRDPSQPNLRQVHLLHTELHDDLRAAGFEVAPGRMGENITTARIALLDLPTGTRLHLGPLAVVELTGLRNPCRQLDDLQPGLMAACLGRDRLGALVRKAGVMAVVVCDGDVGPGDDIVVEPPSGELRALQPV